MRVPIQSVGFRMMNGIVIAKRGQDRGTTRSQIRPSQFGGPFDPPGNPFDDPFFDGPNDPGNLGEPPLGNITCFCQRDASIPGRFKEVCRITIPGVGTESYDTGRECDVQRGACMCPPCRRTITVRLPSGEINSTSTQVCSRP